MRFYRLGFFSDKDAKKRLLSIPNFNEFKTAPGVDVVLEASVL